MAIPWLIGGAVVAAVTAVAAIVSNDDSPSTSSSSSVRDEEQRLERERQQKAFLARKAELQTYIDRTIKNLANKYGGSNNTLLYKNLSAHLNLLDDSDSKVELVSILESTPKFKEKLQTVVTLQDELSRLDSAMLALEVLHDEFK